MATRKEVEAAIASQPDGQTVMVSDGKGKLLASRDGHDSAVLLMLDSDLAERIMDGEPYNARPRITPKIEAALKKKAKADRAKNRRAAKRRKAASVPDTPTRGAQERRSRRQVSPTEPEPPEPPAPQMPGQTSDRLRVV